MSTEGEPKPPLLQQVKAWAEKTGLPLELDAAAAFRKEQFSVAHSIVYADSELDKGREIDVIASKLGQAGFLHLRVVIECKASKKPWLVLVNDEHPVLTTLSFGIRSPHTADQLDKPLEHDNLAAQLKASSTLRMLLNQHFVDGYSLRQVFAEADHDDAYKAAMSTLKASLAVANHPSMGAPRFVFVMPVIVVDSPIIECRVGENGAFEYGQVDASEFRFTAYVPEEIRTTIRIVHRSALDGFSRFCKRFFSELDSAFGKRALDQGVIYMAAKQKPGSTSS